jgi:hypothetical protein
VDVIDRRTALKLIPAALVALLPSRSVVATQDAPSAAVAFVQTTDPTYEELTYVMSMLMRPPDHWVDDNGRHVYTWGSCAPITDPLYLATRIDRD